MSTIKNQIQEDRKTALKAHDKARSSVIQLILAAIKQCEVDERIELDDARVTAVLDKMAKQRRESITQYEAANRTDLVEQETFELGLIQGYLPQPLTSAEVDALIEDAFAQTQATTMQDMAKVMAILKPLIQGRTDAAQVSKKVKERLS